jgi:hypothetical protein
MDVPGFLSVQSIKRQVPDKCAMQIPLVQVHCKYLNFVLMFVKHCNNVHDEEVLLLHLPSCSMAVKPLRKFSASNDKIFLDWCLRTL